MQHSGLTAPPRSAAASSPGVAPLRLSSLILAMGLLGSLNARAVADGTPLSVVTRQSVFGSSVGVGNTLMEHDGRVNFAVRFEGSQATIPLSQMPRQKQSL